MTPRPGDPPAGPALRTDLVLVFIYRAQSASTELLQLRRANPPMLGTWQPVMGSIEPGEPAPAAAMREVREESGLTRETWVEAFALEGVRPFYLASLEAVFMPPTFAVRAPAGWEPTLNAEHDAHRWTPLGRAHETLFWPSQRSLLEELLLMLSPQRSDLRDALRLTF